MSARTSRIATLLLLLLSLGGFHPAFAAPPVVRTPAQVQRSQKMSALAKTRDRNEKGQFLPKVSEQAIAERAYMKWESAGRRDGNAQHDWAQAKRELQDEKAAQNRAARAVAK